jgi:hypothetical protein
VKKALFAELETYVERKCGAGIQHLFAFCHSLSVGGYEASRAFWISFLQSGCADGCGSDSGIRIRTSLSTPVKICA